MATNKREHRLLFGESAVKGRGLEKPSAVDQSFEPSHTGTTTRHGASAKGSISQGQRIPADHPQKHYAKATPYRGVHAVERDGLHLREDPGVPVILEATEVVFGRFADWSRNRRRGWEAYRRAAFVQVSRPIRHLIHIELR